MLIKYCIGLFDGGFGSGVWQCWNCRVPLFLLGWRGTPEGSGIGPGSGCRRGVFAVLWGGWRGTPEKGGIAPGVDAGGDVFEVLRGGYG